VLDFNEVSIISTKMKKGWG